MVQFMERHKDLARGHLGNHGPLAKQNSQKLWEELTSVLNSMGAGQSKPAGKWREYWQTKKSKLKKKIADRKQHRLGTGGGPPVKISFTDIEEQIISLISKASIYGKEDVPVSSVLESLDDEPMQDPTPALTQEQLNTAQFDTIDNIIGPPPAFDTVSTEEIVCFLNTNEGEESGTTTHLEVEEVSATQGSAEVVVQPAEAVGQRAETQPVGRESHADWSSRQSGRGLLRGTLTARLVELEDRRLRVDERRLELEERRLELEERRIALEERRLAIEEQKMRIAQN